MFALINLLLKHMKCFEVQEKNQKVMEWDYFTKYLIILINRKDFVSSIKHLNFFEESAAITS
jgi:hypothetical protein